MSLTYKVIQDLVLSQLDETNTGTRDDVKTYINISGREFTNSRPWHWRRKRAFVSTTTAYATGTVTFTNGSTTVTGSGTTFTSDMVGRKIATAYGAPFYVISAFVSTTEVTLADDYDGTTAAGSAYVIYDDTITLASDVGQVEGVWVHRASQATEKLEEVTPIVMDAIAHIPTRVSHPRAYVVEPNDSYGKKVLRIGPFAPDAEYRIEYTYLKEYTDMLDDGDVCVVPESLIPVMIHKTLSWAYKRDHYQRAQSEMQQYEHALDKAWRLENRPTRGPKATLSRRPMSRGQRPRFTLDS